ncbi:MAG: hypothetical protein V4614_15085 [Pseudomonadota bacterium]
MKHLALLIIALLGMLVALFGAFKAFSIGNRAAGYWALSSFLWSASAFTGGVA